MVLGNSSNSPLLTLPSSVSQAFLISALLTLGPDNYLLLGAVPCIAGCLAASLASTHVESLVATPSCDNQKYLHKFPDVNGHAIYQLLKPELEASA